MIDTKEWNGSRAVCVGWKPGTVAEGLVVNVLVGTVRLFVKNLENWKQPDQEALLVMVKGQLDGVTIKAEGVFTFLGWSNDGAPLYSHKGKLAKFKEYYGKLPDVGVAVKLVMNKNEYWEIVMK